MTENECRYAEALQRQHEAGARRDDAARALVTALEHERSLTQHLRVSGGYREDFQALTRARAQVPIATVAAATTEAAFRAAQAEATALAASCPRGVPRPPQGQRQWRRSRVRGL